MSFVESESVGRIVAAGARRPRAMLGLMAIVLAASGCRQADARAAPKDPPPAPTSADAIPAADLTGQIGGAPFTVRSARYTVDRRPGYEKIDVHLYGAAAETSCGELPADTPSVWLRRRATEVVTPGTFRTSVADGGPWEVHYQTPRGGRWAGVGEANALLVVERVLPDLRVDGELRACFRDETGSCVGGRFTASYCRIEIDAPVRGADVMERLPANGAPVAMPPPVTAKAVGSGVHVTVDPRSELLPTYPCSRCHAGRTPKPERRELKEFHVIRNSDFSHGEDAFWCYQCHSTENIDRLRTATGKLISLDEAFRICVSCHGDKKAPWENGTHGLILGDWNGDQHKKSCPACHDPHSPRFPLIAPMKAPEPIRGASHG